MAQGFGASPNASLLPVNQDQTLRTNTDLILENLPLPREVLSLMVQIKWHDRVGMEESLKRSVRFHQEGL